MQSVFTAGLIKPALAFVFLSMAQPGFAQTTTPATANVKVNTETRESDQFATSNISTFELDNGMKVVVIPDNRAPVVTHMVWYKVGSAEDPIGKSGVAHFLEHLMFKGTKTVPGGEFSAKIAEIGGQENAFTSVDYTAYYQKVAPSALKMMMRYEADRMENLVLTDEQVIPELKVVLEERKSRVDRSPGAILGETMDALIYVHHPYGIPIIGFEHEIEKLTREDAIAFYDKYYSPNNAILVVAGDVDEKTVREYALETYAKVKRRAEPGKRIRVRDPKPISARTVTYHDKRVTTPAMSRVFLVPSYSQSTNGEAEALDILSVILAGTSQGRFHKKLALEKEMVTNVSAAYSGGYMDSTRFSISASPRGDTTIEEVEKEIERLVAELLEKGVSAEELDHARGAMIKAEVYARDSQTTMARIIGSVYATGGNLADVTQWSERLKKVTVEDINQVARKYLHKHRSVTGYLLPDTNPES